VGRGAPAPSRPAPRTGREQVLTGLKGQGAAGGGFDRLIHEHTRLAIMSALAVVQSLSFTELKAAVKATDGNLSVHARKLEEAGYVTCRKGFAGRVPRTEFSLTKSGRQALGRYLDHMEALIYAVRRT